MSQISTMEPNMRMPLAASLFSIDGKLALSLVELLAESAVALTDTPPPHGSIAILVRNRVRVFCTVAGVEGQRIALAFDDPLQGWSLEDFSGDVAESIPAARKIAA